MVTRYGMSDKIGPVALESPSGRVLFGMGVTDHEYSDRVAAEIDSEVARIMTEGREKAAKTLIANKKGFRALLEILFYDSTR